MAQNPRSLVNSVGRAKYRDMSFCDLLLRALRLTRATPTSKVNFSVNFQKPTCPSNNVSHPRQLCRHCTRKSSGQSPRRFLRTSLRSLFLIVLSTFGDKCLKMAPKTPPNPQSVPWDNPRRALCGQWCEGLCGVAHRTLRGGGWVVEGIGWRVEGGG